MGEEIYIPLFIGSPAIEVVSEILVYAISLKAQLFQQKSAKTVVE